MYFYFCFIMFYCYDLNNNVFGFKNQVLFSLSYGFCILFKTYQSESISAR